MLTLTLHKDDNGVDILELCVIREHSHNINILVLLMFVPLCVGCCQLRDTYYVGRMDFSLLGFP